MRQTSPQNIRYSCNMCAKVKSQQAETVKTSRLEPETWYKATKNRILLKGNKHGRKQKRERERRIYLYIHVSMWQCRDVSILEAASSQPASLLQAAGDACIFMMLAPNWFSSTYRNRQAWLPTLALLHSYELCHGLNGQLHNYTKLQ
jgi:hypothetical protein